MYRIKLPPVFRAVFQRVGLVELKRIALLRIDIHSHHIESRPVVTHPGATGTTKQI
jgi:hypothetical protein